ncbi:MAG: succinylglutamate desuccinylase/aspartoacylase family protein [Firmicutes bacterium]|jgi:predicted deacylase|nr:succinylglutamate desuccinylase/aspartoacylase family protein [Bacillota bacterium]
MEYSKKQVGDLVGFELEIYQFGQGDGPKLMVTAGVHGGEVTGIHAARRLIEFLQENESQLKGQVKILPVCNQGAYRRMQRSNPYDEIDMNRIFPGKMGSKPTLATAALVYEEAAWPDYLVDLHCCGLYGSNYTLATWMDSEGDKELASMLDIPVVIKSGGTAGQLFVESSQKRNIPSVIIELSGGQPTGQIDLDSADIAYQALLKLMKKLGMLPGEVEPFEPAFCLPLERVVAIEDGLFLPQIEKGTWVEKGQVIGSLNGKPISVEQDCRVMNIGPARYLFRGDYLYVYTVRA